MTKANRDGELMSVNEAAAWLGVTRQIVYRWAEEGAIPAIRISHSVFIVRRRLQAMVAGLEWRYPEEHVAGLPIEQHLTRNGHKAD
jgi:excisionase family DNA binding protein